MLAMLTACVRCPHGSMGIATLHGNRYDMQGKPGLGGVGPASMKVPTPRRFLTINGSTATTAVGVPCNTRATVCVMMPSTTSGVSSLRLDGEVLLTEAYRIDGHHACVDELGCGAGDAMRTLSFA